MRNELGPLGISTRDGTFTAYYSGRGLTGLTFPARGSANLHRRVSAQQNLPAAIRGWHRVTTNAVRQTVAGCAPRSLPPLDISAGTAFQRRVWCALRKIACGQTRSYGEIARAIGRPKAARAVGAACGANPIPVLLPCHRVLAANKKIGGFSGGLDWKRKLLRREGVVLFTVRQRRK